MLTGRPSSRLRKPGFLWSVLHSLFATLVVNSSAVNAQQASPNSTIRHSANEMKLATPNQFVIEANGIFASARIPLKQLEQLSREKVSRSLTKSQIRLSVTGEPGVIMQIFEQLKLHNPSCGMQSLKLERDKSSTGFFEVSTTWFCYES